MPWSWRAQACPVHTLGGNTHASFFSHFCRCMFQGVWPHAAWGLGPPLRVSTCVAAAALSSRLWVLRAASECLSSAIEPAPWAVDLPSEGPDGRAGPWCLYYVCNYACLFTLPCSLTWSSATRPETRLLSSCPSKCFLRRFAVCYLCLCCHQRGHSVARPGESLLSWGLCCIPWGNPALVKEPWTRCDHHQCWSGAQGYLMPG